VGKRKPEFDDCSENVNCSQNLGNCTAVEVNPLMLETVKSERGKLVTIIFNFW
jgi:hypothetical protein